MVEQAQTEGTELTNFVKELPPEQQEAMEPKLVELDQRLAAMIDKVTARESAVDAQLERATELNKEVSGDGWG